MFIEEEVSKRITSLRFLLSVAIVFTHCLVFEMTGILSEVQNFIRYINQPVVPLFFFFSSYILFLKEYNYDQLLKKKFFGLFVPYVLWITLFILYKCFSHHIAYLILPGLVTKPEVFYTSEWTFVDWIRAYTFMPDGSLQPILRQFWFVRQLIFFVLISPVIRILIRKVPFYFLFVVSVFYLIKFPFISDIENYCYFLPLFYGSLGALFAEKKINFFYLADKINWILIIVVYFLFYFFLITIDKFACFLNVTLLLLMFVFWLKISKLLINSDKLFQVLHALSGYSFFLYANHYPWCTDIKNFIFRKVFSSQCSNLCYFLQFLSGGIFCICMGTLAGVMLKRFFNRGFRLLNGGR